MRLPAALFVAIALPAWPSAPAAADRIHRDWTRYPAVIDTPPTAIIYAIGDIHGDYERLARLLVAARIAPAIPERPEAMGWSGGGATLVVTGDMIDKGPRPVDVLRALIALRNAARESHGNVILLAGNHEAEFLESPHSDKAAQFAADLKKKGYSPGAVAACKTDLGEFLCSLPFAARIGEWFFSHAGNIEGRSVEQIAADIRRSVDRHGIASSQLTGPDSLLEARLGEEKSWFNNKNGAEGERELLRSYAQALGAKHMVQGHQHNEVRFADGVERHTGEMFQRWGLLFLIDVGMSRGVGDSLGAALRIADGKAVAICPDDSETLLWDAAANTDMGRAAPCKAVQ